MKSSIGGSLVFMDSDEDMQDALSGDMNEKNEDGDFEEEEEDNDHVLSDTEEDEFGGEESDYGFDETMTDELQPSRRYGQPTYIILSEKDIKHRQDEAVSKVVGVLSISRIEAGILLRHFKWSVNRVNDEWFTDEDKVRRTLGLFVKPASGVRIDSKELACGICFEPWPREAMKSAVCGHYFCNLCWTGYAHTSINDGMGCLMLRCPQPDCHASVGEDIILSLVTDDDRARYTRYMLRSYVEDNRKMKWCPGRDCEYAVDFTPGSAPYDIVCKCGHNFCWNCLEDAHRPVDCDTVSKWILKNCAESENMNWILANSKPCPKCKRPIEKNQGCMHITCTPPCKFEFCWLCLGAWSEHGERTGGFYACNKYEVAKQEGLYDEAERRREMAKNSLERYTHYYERWATNESSRAKALSDLQQMEAIQIELLSEMQCQPVSQLKFVTESWLQIIECRRVLKWTYAYGYYIPEQELAKRSLFEYLQGEAEAGLERLHKCAEKDLQNYLEAAHAPSQICFNDFRTRLAGLTSVTKNYFENLVRALENGLADVNSKQQLVGGGKASSSSSSKASSSGGGKVKPVKPRGSTSKSNANRQEEDAEDDSFWACNACTFNNDPQVTVCAMCQRPRF